MTYDAQANAVYIHIVELEDIEAAEAESQQFVTDDITLDYDRQGKLLGIEILNARRMLRPSVLFRAARIAESGPEGSKTDENLEDELEPA
jgi:uncharacterized protein YuzE